MDRQPIVSPALHLFFFCSGASGLVYQVIWVREFGYIFGNTIYSAALVIAVFMCGLGVGSYLGGRWADRRPGRLLAAYALLELAVGLLALGVALLLPKLGAVSAALSSYSRGAGGWYVLSTPSYLARYLIAVILLAPITTLMGATLTVLIRHVVRRDLMASGWRIGALYGVNTAGAALGCFLTDQLLVPAAGLFATQLGAVLLNLVAAAGAWGLDSREPRMRAWPPPPEAAPTDVALDAGQALALAALALALSGFAALGMEIVWFRHITSLLGGLRTVFSLLLTVILVGIWLGAVAGGWLDRRFGRPALWFALSQAGFVAATLLGLAAADVRSIVAEQRAAAPAFFAASGGRRAVLEVWLNLWPILREVGVPALMMGLSFPLANAVVQRVQGVVGRCAGVLYLANTLGAVAGSAAVGFALLPALGMQRSATALALTAALAAGPLYLAERRLAGSAARAERVTVAAALTAALMAVGLWSALPADHLLLRTLQPLDPGTRLLAIREGLTEVVAVTEERNGSRGLFTNGHPMSATNQLAQRYMRALAHIPLLAMERRPESVLVICFGVGNTANAASLHPSVRRLDVVDLSREILDHAGYFARWNGGVLGRPGVTVYLNDGRQHLRMQPPATYDLITLEPPPIEQAGVGALYSRQFYALARSRLKPGGYLTQWLPAYQVPAATTLAMVRAFIDVFPQAVLLSGVDAHLILMGVNGPGISIDPELLAARLRAAPAVQADLSQVRLGYLTELVGTFVASGETLTAVTRSSVPATDDRPRQEYTIRSRLKDIRMPAALFAVGDIGTWCPACFVGGRPSPLVPQLDLYMETVGRRYHEASFLEYRLPVGIGR